MLECKIALNFRMRKIFKKVLIFGLRFVVLHKEMGNGEVKYKKTKGIDVLSHSDSLLRKFINPSLIWVLIVSMPSRF